MPVTMKKILKHRLLGSIPRLYDSTARFRVGPRICMSKKLPGDVDAARDYTLRTTILFNPESCNSIFLNKNW